MALVEWHNERIAPGMYLEGLAVTQGDNVVWYSDVIAGGVHGYDGRTVVATLNCDRLWIGGLLIDAAGCILSTGQGGVLRTDPHTGDARWLLETINGQPVNGINEMAPDAAGGFYFGTADLDAIIRGAPPGPASLYRLAADGVLHLVHGSVGFANGMALSADGRMLFLNESFDGTYVFDVLPDRTLANRRRLLAKHDCDGLALDSDGIVWITGFRSPQITRITPDGTVLEPVETPAQAITQIRFGGDDMRDVWITCVAADAGEKLADGTPPDGDASCLYRGRSTIAGYRLPPVLVAS